MDEHEADAWLSFAREGDRELRGLQAGAWRDRLQDRTPELETAFAWFLDHDRAGDALAMAIALANLARVSGRLAAGREWLDRAPAADALQARQGNAWPPDERPHFEHSRAAVTGALDPAQLRRAWSAGEAMSLADAVGYALARSGLEQ